MRLVAKIFAVVVLLTASSFSFAKPAFVSQTDSLETVDRHLSGFTSIKIAGPFDVHLVQGTDESVKFEASKEFIDHIVTEVDGGVLKIHHKHDNWGWGVKSWYSDKGIWHNHKKIVVYIVIKDIKAITMSGSGDINFDEGLKAAALKLVVRGSGQVKGKIDVNTLESRISGSGSIQITGNAESSTVRVVGSGDFTGRDLITVNSAVHVSGSGHAQVNANGQVDAAVRGSGNVSYSGAAKSVKRSTSGSGEISRY